MPFTSKQFRFLLSSGSPLSKSKKRKIAAERRARGASYIKKPKKRKKKRKTKGY